MRLLTTRLADEEIVEIYVSGVRRFGEAQAERYHAGLAAALDFIRANPRAVRERHELSPPVRLHFYGAHVVVYVLRETDILVVRVLHGRQDWQRHLG